MKKGLWMFGEEKEDTRRLKISKKKKTKKSNHGHEYIYYKVYVKDSNRSTHLEVRVTRGMMLQPTKWAIYKLCKECGKSSGWDESGFVWCLNQEEFEKALIEGIEEGKDI